MLEVWPAYWRYYHRPAGSPVPADLRAGLTFGVCRSPAERHLPPLAADVTRTPTCAGSLYGYPGYHVDEDATSLANYDPTGYGTIYTFRRSFEKFAPWNLDEDTLTRLETMLSGK